MVTPAVSRDVLVSRTVTCALLLCLLAAGIACPRGTDDDDDDSGDDDDSSDDDDDDASAPAVVTEDEGSWTCRPAGAGPFPAVLYNHGGLGDAVGGDLEGTCRALADAGYLGHAVLRRNTMSLAGHLDDVFAGLGVLLGHPDADAGSVGILGFSRGGLLTLQALKERPEVFDAAVLMAPAHGNGQLQAALEDVGMIEAPVLVLVAENDLFQADHVALAAAVVQALEDASKPVEHILYPPFGADGHELFFEVGDYWSDVLEFLGPRL